MDVALPYNWSTSATAADLTPLSFTPLPLRTYVVDGKLLVYVDSTDFTGYLGIKWPSNIYDNSGSVNILDGSSNATIEIQRAAIDDANPVASFATTSLALQPWLFTCRAVFTTKGVGAGNITPFAITGHVNAPVRSLSYMYGSHLTYRSFPNAPNFPPVITSQPSASYALANDGTPTVITVAATDPEGAGLTYGYEVVSGSPGMIATVTQSGNVFTITPSMGETYSGSFTLRFSASDGYHTTYTTSATFTKPSTAPTITSSLNASYALAIDGTPTVITVTATDAEGSALTYAYEAVGGTSLGSVATVIQAGNAFTITPSTNPLNAGSFQLRFSVTDGVNTTYTNGATFTLSWPPGGLLFATPGTYSWKMPANVTTVSVVCVGGGGGGSYTADTANAFVGSGAAGGGGGLGWKNNIAVTPGQAYTIVVGEGGRTPSDYTWRGTAGGNSYFVSESTVCGRGGDSGSNLFNYSSSMQGGYRIGGAGGGYAGDGGGAGGQGGSSAGMATGSGGGTGGYSGAGGVGGYKYTSPTSFGDGTSGSGGGGGGGRLSTYQSTGGGGVGIYGQGADGAVGNNNPSNGGYGGSGGANGASNGPGGAYGGGGGGGCNISGNNSSPGAGAGGAVRLIWGMGRSFPTANANLASSGGAEVTVPGITTFINDVYVLATNGTATTITLNTTMSSPTYGYEVVSGSPGSIATVSQSSNVFTITPSTNQANVGSFVLRFYARDAADNYAYTKNAMFVLSFPGSVVYQNPGTFSWTAPVGVTNVSVMCVGGGGSGAVNYSGGSVYNGTGGGGGGLGWKNAIPVTPGQAYAVKVGNGGTPVYFQDYATHGDGRVGVAGGESYFINASTVCGYGGGGGSYGGAIAGGAGGGYVGTGGGNGGAGGNSYNYNYRGFGGGGAGGYSGTGGMGCNSTGFGLPFDGSGGGGGGGLMYSYRGGGGGGVSVYGEGSSGLSPQGTLYGGNGGSGGGTGHGNSRTASNQVFGGYYGGGGAGSRNSAGHYSGGGASGVVRIVWGFGRAFPTTNVNTSTNETWL